MDRQKIKDLLTKVADGNLAPEQALQKLADFPAAELGYARLDTQRAVRTGFPEVVFCPGKTTEEILGIAEKLTASHDRILLTRAEPAVYEALARVIPEAVYDQRAKTIVICRREPPRVPGRLLIVTAGTSDMPVALEALQTARIMGIETETLFDSGVAGLHRIVSQREKISSGNVLIVVAGMDGVLPGVVAGLVGKPVIAVPTDTGYGANFAGVAPLLTMLNSCASGLAVVNINNGFGAACMAYAILNCFDGEREG